MNQVKEMYQFKGMIYVVPAQPVLQHVNFAFFRKGDETLAFSPMAKDLFDTAPMVDEVQVYNKSIREESYINIRLNNKTPLSDADMAQVRAFMNDALAKNRVIDEQGLLAWSNADENKIKGQQHTNRIDKFSADYLHNVIVPAIIESTKSAQTPNGHKAELTFVRYIDDGENGMKLGVAMGSQCKGCTTSFLKTVSTAHGMIDKLLKDVQFPKKLTGVVILPNVQGSPSMSVTPRPPSVA